MLANPAIAILQARQKLYQTIRSYFAQHAVLEVQTPIMDSAGNTDPAIDSFQTWHANLQPAWLRTSPEFFHKRLLSKNVGSLFEIAKVFRRGEVSTRHQTEFTMLEYYRVGFDEFALMDCLTALLSDVHRAFGKPAPQFQRISYRQWFMTELALDPFIISSAQLQQRVAGFGAVGQFTRDECLDLIRTHELESKLSISDWLFVYDFPASQAALAQLNTDGLSARRFELFGGSPELGSVELANGYFELTDASEQRQRFQADLAKRQAQGLPAVALDQALLAALASGLPSCAGVAVGLDRLLMILLGIADIAQLQVWR